MTPISDEFQTSFLDRQCPYLGKSKEASCKSEPPHRVWGDILAALSIVTPFSFVSLFPFPYLSNHPFLSSLSQ
ncbi:unnamed protein product, partial [Sphenostylis stenocarpa]